MCRKSKALIPAAIVNGIARCLLDVYNEVGPKVSIYDFVDFFNRKYSKYGVRLATDHCLKDIVIQSALLYFDRRKHELYIMFIESNFGREVKVRVLIAYDPKVFSASILNLDFEDLGPKKACVVYSLPKYCIYCGADNFEVFEEVPYFAGFSLMDLKCKDCGNFIAVLRRSGDRKKFSRIKVIR